MDMTEWFDRFDPLEKSHGEGIVNKGKHLPYSTWLLKELDVLIFHVISTPLLRTTCGHTLVSAPDLVVHQMLVQP